MPLHICKYCGSEFQSRDRERKYCSVKCSNNALLRYKPVLCKNCNKSFYPRNKQEFCSKKCYFSHCVSSGKRRKLKKKVCKQCRKTFQPRKASQKFCSKACVDDNKRANHLYVCEHCGKTFRPSKASQRFCNHFCSARALGEKTKGAKSPVWTGGRGSYRGPNWKKQRARARKRDNYTCQHCGITKKQLDQPPDIHHIIPYRSFNDDWKSANQLRNLISLCPSCHAKVEMNT